MRRFDNFRLKAFIAVAALAFAAAGVVDVPAQKPEYNSPLYSPKIYDPTEKTADGLPQALEEIGIEQKLGEQLPLDTEFKDEHGNIVKIGDYFNKGKPIVLAFVYYECPMLCNEVLNGLSGTLRGISFDAGKEFDVVALSFDTRENDIPELGKNKKAAYMERYGRPGTEDGWHFLTGKQESIDAVAKAAGFNYRWDEQSGQFAHAGGIMVVTPDGRMSKYFYGIDYAAKDLKFGIMESAENKVGDPVDRLLLYCFHYDPATGQYGLAIMRVVRIAAVFTILGMAFFGFVFWRRGRNKQAAS